MTASEIGETFINYFRARKEFDPFPDARLLDSTDLYQDEYVRVVEKMLREAGENGLSGDDLHNFQTHIQANVNVIRVSLLLDCQPVSFCLKSTLCLANPDSVRLRDYSQEQRSFTSNFVKMLVQCKMVYRNPTSPCACAPILLPNLGNRSIVLRWTCVQQIGLP